MSLHDISIHYMTVRYMTYVDTLWESNVQASLAQLVEHALRKRMVRGSIPLGG